jgi:GNAT superfamily N-acetyltransferase
VTTVRRLTPCDRDAWNRLWAGYLEYYEHVLAPEVTEAVFAQLTSESGRLAGLVAEGSDGRLAGFAHLVFHPSTWAVVDYCYLEDLFVDPAERRTGVARALIFATFEEADRRGAAKTYWQTQETNREGRALYDQLAKRSGYLVYERPD